MWPQTFVGRFLFFSSLGLSCYAVRIGIFVRSHPTWVITTITLQQAAGTVWFWWANIGDQLRASGTGENAATWLGGGLVFLTITALLQLRVTRLMRTRTNIVVCTIQIISALGNLAALIIFINRRGTWTATDSLCLALIAGIALVWLAVYCWRRPRQEYRDHMRHFIVAGPAMAMIAIEFRAVPRLVQGPSLLLNNPMSFSLVAVQSRSKTSRQLWTIELFGNMGSQIVLGLGWVTAVMI
jgi:hypothetical protein